MVAQKQINYLKLQDPKRIWHNQSMTIELPEYAYVVRSLGCGLHPYRKLLPRFEESPAARRLIGEISHIFLKSAFAISDNCILN
jgi:hypothetical protein